MIHRSPPNESDNTINNKKKHSANFRPVAFWEQKQNNNNDEKSILTFILQTAPKLYKGRHGFLIEEANSKNCGPPPSNKLNL